MVSLSFMLLQMVFIFLIIKYTVAHSDQAKKTFVVHEAKNGQAMALKCYLSVEKEVLDGVPAAAELTNGRVGGRKMMIELTNLKKNMKQLEADSKNSSGNSNSSASLLGESRKNIQNQGDKGKNLMKSASGRNSKNSTNKLASTYQPDDNETFQKLESEKLLEDTTEFFTMMNKDYTGGPGTGSKTHHKHNFQPYHRSNP
ncbi:hypothetical protein K7X08_034745 [Anisodus acutangulus]|uniref:Uncharacterized protein n=1 Tax=Anisodus acutangulus TaxID=402998 RepID=A0A9Q1LJU7_9SOLA|nr:hypothetical protein K7X08_034745 [Anisodus acutangulus]